VDFEYWEHVPRGPLARFVESMWLTLAPRALYQRLCVLPDGRSVAMLNLGLPQGVHRPAGVQICRRAWLCGPQTGPLTVLAGEDHRFLGIWFRRGGAAPFWGCPIGTLVDQVIELEDLWGAFAEEVRERVLAALEGRDGGGPGGAFRIVEQALLARAAGALAADPLVAAAIERLGGALEPQRVGRLAAELGVTQRHLARLFHRHVGPSPKLHRPPAALPPRAGRRAGARAVVDCPRPRSGLLRSVPPHSRLPVLHRHDAERLPAPARGRRLAARADHRLAPFRDVRFFQAAALAVP